MSLKGAKGTVSIVDKATSPLRSIAKAFQQMGKSSKKANKELNIEREQDLTKQGGRFIMILINKKG